MSWRHNVTVRCCQDVEEARHEIHILIQMFSNFYFLWHWSQVLYFFLISRCDFLLFLLFVKYPDIWKLIFSHLEAYKLGLTDYICAISSLAFEMFRPHKKNQFFWPMRSKKIWQLLLIRSKLETYKYKFSHEINASCCLTFHLPLTELILGWCSLKYKLYYFEYLIFLIFSSSNIYLKELQLEWCSFKSWLLRYEHCKSLALNELILG